MAVASGLILVQNPGSPIDPKPTVGSVSADGSNERLLTTEPRVNVAPDGFVIQTTFDANAPAWSPTGRSIAFWSGIETQTGQIWTIWSDGLGSRQLTANPLPANTDDPSWSPDATMIPYSTSVRGTIEEWVMNADGSGQRPFCATEASPFPGGAAWQPTW